MTRTTLLLSTVLVLTAGCGATDAITEGAARLLISPSEEVALGAEVSNELEAELTIHPDADVQAYLQNLGDSLLPYIEQRYPDEYQFRFTVVDEDATVNAFALPGGRIYFYTGLLLAAESEAEVIGVLAHEISHVIERHSAQRIVTQFGIESAVAMALGENPGQLVQLATLFATNSVTLKYNREQELEADEVGFGIMVRAGYDPNAFIDFFRKLEGGARLPEFLSTHPNPDNRIEELQAMISRLGDVPTNRGDAEAFAAFQSSL